MSMQCSQSQFEFVIYFLIHTLSQIGGSLKQPTPGGVPVSTTSPGSRVINLQNTDFITIG